MRIEFGYCATSGTGLKKEIFTSLARRCGVFEVKHSNLIDYKDPDLGVVMIGSGDGGLRRELGRMIRERDGEMPLVIAVPGGTHLVAHRLGVMAGFGITPEQIREQDFSQIGTLRYGKISGHQLDKEELFVTAVAPGGVNGQFVKTYEESRHRLGTRIAETYAMLATIIRQYTHTNPVNYYVHPGRVPGLAKKQHEMETGKLAKVTIEGRTRFEVLRNCWLMEMRWITGSQVTSEMRSLTYGAEFEYELDRGQVDMSVDGDYVPVKGPGTVNVRTSPDSFVYFAALKI